MRPAGECSRTGVALIMVILILAALLAIAVPLVYICHSNETSAARTLDQQIARRYALSALELAKGQLRRGTYENELRAAYTPPTPPPPLIATADTMPFDTPRFDTPGELLVPQAELDNAIPKVLPNGDTVTVSVEVEDEQGKLNLNSITPEILRGLYLAVFRIDPKDLSAEDRAALKAHFEHLIDPIAMLRFSSGSYAPLRSVEQIRNFSTTDSGTTYQLSETEYEAMRPFLTVHSWRPSADGFERTRLTEIPPGLQEARYFTNCFGCPYRLRFYGSDKAVLADSFAISVDAGNAGAEIPFPGKPPTEARFSSTSVEEFHPVNVNTADPTVLLALCLAPIDISNPAYGLQDAIALARGIRVSGRVKSITSGSEHSIIELTDDSDDFASKSPGLITCGGWVISFTRLDRTHLECPADLSSLATAALHPLDVRTVVRNTADLFPTGGQSVSKFSAYLDRLKRPIVSAVSYDVYTVNARCSIVSPSGQESARWCVTECVCVGSPPSDEPVPATLDTEADFIDIAPNSPTNRLRDPMKRRISHSWLADRSPAAVGYPETSPPSHWLSPRLDGFIYLESAAAYVEAGSGPSLASRNADKMHIAESVPYRYSPHGEYGYGAYALSYTSPESRRTLTSDRQGGTFHASDLGTPISAGLFPFRANLAFGGWFKAIGWDPATDPNLHRIFSVGPQPGNRDSIRLYVANGRLTLRVVDDSGVAGSFSYVLTPENFPRDVWMLIFCHVGGNQPGQCSIFVDNRPVPLEYSTTASRADGYCLSLLDRLPSAVPITTGAVEESATSIAVDSTVGYPESGYLRIGDEVVAYSEKDSTSFLNLRRGIGGTHPGAYASGTKILPCAIVHPDSLARCTALPSPGDDVCFLAYSTPESDIRRQGYYHPLNSILDLGLVTDPGIATIFCTTPGTCDVGIFFDFGTQFVFCGTSGTMGTGSADVYPTEAFFLASKDGADAFAGDIGRHFIALPQNPVFRLPSDLDSSESDPTRSFLGAASNSPLDGQISLFQVGSEIIGASKDPDKTSLHRGLLGTTPVPHGAGEWVVPLDCIQAMSVPTDIPADATSVPSAGSAFDALSARCWRIDDEIIYFYSNYGSNSVRLYRGRFGSKVADHSADAVAVYFPLMSQGAHSLDSDDSAERATFDFSLTRPGMRISGLTWKDLAPDPFVQLHFWADVADDHDFVREPVSPNVFHFTSKSKDFSISRNGEPVLTDNVTVRMMHEYLRGAWLPNDPTRHSWKVLPQIDKIELWIQEPDVVFEHREHP